MYIVVALLCFVAATHTVMLDPLLKKEWDAFKVEQKKTYEANVDSFRLKIFAENKQEIEKHNLKYSKKLVSYKLKINSFTDMQHDEFIKMMNGFNASANVAHRSSRMTFASPAHVSLPEQVDWTQAGAVTAVKNQGQCGSCWAFSATGALEGQYFRKTGSLISLSEQNLIDCSKPYGNNGCGGGSMDAAFHYVKDNHGIDTEQSYPYTGVDVNGCRYNPQTSVIKNLNYVDIPSGDERKLMEAVATIGPVSVAIDASPRNFQNYGDGVYDDTSCSSRSLNHGVLVVGYGTTSDGLDYWLVKNSWGTSWGNNGYIKIARNKNNLCGIASGASFPQL